MSTLKPILQHVLLDSAGFGLDGRGDEIEELDDIVHDLSTVAMDFSIQCEASALRHLEELCRKSNGDMDASFLHEVLARAPIRHVPSADVSSIVAGESQFFEPRPFVALTTDENELDFPSEYLGAHITALSAFPNSSWMQEAISLRQQSVIEFTRKEAWDRLFQNFLFAPRVFFCDRYLLTDVENCLDRGKLPSTNSGFSYLVTQLSHLWNSSLDTEQHNRPRTLHILTSVHDRWNEAQPHQVSYIKILKAMLDELSPQFDVEFTITDAKLNGKSVLHERFCAVSSADGNILRVLIPTQSIGSYFGNKSSRELMTFSYQTQPSQTAVFGSYWTQKTNEWRGRGFRYIWKAKKP
jgi:hypothetical protein